MTSPDAVRASPRVREYFSLQAPEYQKRSTGFPWAWVRRRELLAVRSLLGDLAAAEVLELGAGSGFYTRELIRAGASHVWAVDVSEAMLATLPGGPITPVLGDAETIRLNKRFPVVVSAGMLEFVQDPAAVLANAAGHADAGARFVLLVPRTSAAGHVYRRFHHAHGLSIRLFDRTWFETMAPQSNWRVETSVRVWPFSLAVRLRRAG
jgi:2-polyprenyl-3-methyl-5-hydroxy-6-metoxy-1,4-benzoquinol methylase